MGMAISVFALLAPAGIGIGTSATTYPLDFRTAPGDKIALWSSANGRTVGFGVGGHHELQVHTDNTNFDIVFGSGSSGNLAEVMRIQGTGNVGIGTASPLNMLDVQGSADFIGNVGIGTTVPANMLDVIGSADFRGNVGIGTTVPANMLEVQGTADFTGNVGIGTTTPGKLLQIGSPTSTTDGMIRLSCGNGGAFRSWDIGVPYGNNNPDSPYYGFVINDASVGATRFAIDFNTGNVGIGTTNPAAALDVAGEINCTAINITSDRNAKEDFQTVNPRQVLAKVTALPITEWQYKADKANNTASRHIGPMAQDFSAAFALNHDDKHISVVDEGGVALAAIQGLNEKGDERDARIREQEIQIQTQTVEIRKLSQALADLQTIVGQMQQNVQKSKAE